MAAHEHEERADLMGGGLLSDRLRASHDGYQPVVEREPEERPAGADVSLGTATNLEIDSGHVSFLVPFASQWPNEYWLRAFSDAHTR